MDTDHLSTAVVFAVALLFFAFVSLGQYVSGPMGSVFRNGNSSLRVLQGLLWCKFACVIAATVSAVLFLTTFNLAAWWSIALLSVVVLIALAVIDRLTRMVTSGRPTASRRALRPLARVLAGGPDRSSAVVGNGSLRLDPTSDIPWEDSASVDEPVITEADLVNMDQRDREMLRSILSLDISNAREIMVPRLDMMTIEVSSSLADVADLMVQGGHSRIPVYEESIDHIVGIVHSREVLDALAHPPLSHEIRYLMNPPFVIPESKRLDDLLEEFQERGVQMAIVVDEYGGTEGLVTMEDVLEEIVGEIEDEFSRDREPLLEATGLGEALVDARVSTEDIEALFGIPIDSPDVDTVGGYVYQSLGRIPVAGDAVTTDELRIEVVSVLGRRLRKLRIYRTGKDEVSPAG